MMRCVAAKLRQEIVSGRFPSEATTIDKKGVQISSPHPWHVDPIEIAGEYYSPKSPTGFMFKPTASATEQQNLFLDTLLYLWFSKDLNTGDFVLIIRKNPDVVKGLQRVGQTVRDQVLKYLTGTLEADQLSSDLTLNLHVAPEFSGAAEGSGVLGHLANDTRGGVSFLGRDGGVHRGSRGLFDDLMAEERSKLDWNAVLTHGKKYSSVLEKLDSICRLVEHGNGKGAADAKDKGKDSKKRPAPEKAIAPEAKKSKKTLLVPIILLPNEFDSASLVTVYNVHEFLANGRWFDPNEKRKDTVSRGKTRDKVVISRPAVKTNGQTKANFEFRSDPQKMTAEDWQRVVAVFVSGQNWQFKQYRPSTEPSVVLNTCNQHFF
eukprot:TRINITY_DN7444_c0_g1_i2.p1 TRINITY_DN7444_c0_g1~~TRINITY_DN7444_c0_g1_i2.p1  ORF type:complete len:376 (-),score=74.13 TRINITY_DN7444_c0_g1_i2:949-2076(-)